MTLRTSSAVRVHLRTILNNEAQTPYSLQDFERFLKSEHTSENLSFWLLASEYRKEASQIYSSYVAANQRQNDSEIHRRSVSSESTTGSIPSLRRHSRASLADIVLSPSDHAVLQQKLKILVATFLTPGADQELNINGAVRKRIVAEIDDKGAVYPGVLDAVMDKVYDMLRLGSYPRFIKLASTGQIKPPASLDRTTTENTLPETETDTVGSLPAKRPRSPTLTTPSTPAPVRHQRSLLKKSRRASNSEEDKKGEELRAAPMTPMPRRKNSFLEKIGLRRSSSSTARIGPVGEEVAIGGQVKVA
ncbi:uncharacterized protein SPPG_05634 [Spizellomyces punctatus DAOM BR117]|uniref:RGS domain-containing protein n=1 Tax=Spizellomyces punctatus (strain DAOM BR117) TaxID=645134 RepID=A0A0L0HED5_SPIPD|nr:uncharacterized protein SPPG_05634 [Spizellomyces punctatus DAOM BR117]KNC99391.1 hypothetical protein SPPG_05634 [Spizellomyces punctatus DAOM BR117]|eukprot:XP_016607431.1 hypothetical protein SPPG_05634 [Spizellomyces punctatus DAOM BR117]